MGYFHKLKMCKNAQNDLKSRIWQKFGGNWQTFLSKDADLCDVTLVCEEDKQIESHRIILSAGSPFFSTVLKKISTPIQ